MIEDKASEKQKTVLKLFSTDIERAPSEIGGGEKLLSVLSVTRVSLNLAKHGVLKITDNTPKLKRDWKFLSNQLSLFGE